MSNQYLRKCSLIVYGTPPPPGGTGLPIPSASPPPSSPSATSPTSPSKSPGIELGTLRVQFSTTAMDVDAPPTATIRVINPSDKTAKAIQNEFSGVILSAGYENGNFGVIFKGTIIRVRRGRLNNIETFVDIMASNWDIPFNFGFVNTSVAKGSTTQSRLKAIQNSANNSPALQSANAKASTAGEQGFQLGYIPSSLGTGGTLPRGKVMFGLARDYLNDLSDTAGCTWFIGNDSKVNLLQVTGYLPNKAVVKNAQTGLIGVPEATQQGIEFDCLLDPNIQVGTRVQLNNAGITTTVNRENIGFPAYSDFQFFANTANDGIYRALVVEHHGDSRGFGDDWKTHVVALALDQSVTPNVTSKTALGYAP